MLKKENGEIETIPVSFLLAIAALTSLGAFLIVKVSISTSLLVVMTFVIIVISFLNVKAALYLLVASMLLSPEFLVGGLSGRGTGGRGITIRFDDILILIIGLGWFAKAAIKKDLGLFLKTPLNGPIALYLIVCLVSTLIGFAMGRLHLSTGLLYVLKYFEYFIVYFIAANHITDKKQIKRFVIVMLAVCMIICVIAILQIPAGGRVTAPFEGEAGEPNTLGGYLVLMLSLTLALLVTSDTMKVKGKAFLGILVVLIMISLLATLSRSSWLAIVPMLLTLIYFTKRKLMLVVPLIIIVLLSPFIMPHIVKERALYTVTQRIHPGQHVEVAGVRLDTSTSARINSWKTVLTKDFIKHPILGHGVTGYSFLDAQYPRILIETGILGFITFFLLIFFIYRNAFGIYRNVSDPFLRGISIGYMAAFVGMLFLGIGSNVFVIVRIMEPFWFLTAIVIMIPTIEAGEVETKV